jgi:FkbM family methyltransferase
MRSYLSWFLQLVNGAFGRRRFIRLTPWGRRKRFGRYYDKLTRSEVGVHVRNTVDQGTADQIFVHEDYAFRKLERFQEIKAWFQDIIEAGETPLTIDCGANIGLAAKYFSREFPGSCILCVEPDEQNLAEARKNNTGDANVHFLRAAVGAQRAKGSITNMGAATNAFQVRAGDGDIDVLTMEDLIHQGSGHARRARLFIVKLDIEGYEENVFAGDPSWIDSVPVLVVELHDWMLPGRAVSRNFLKAIADRNRDLVILGENLFSIRNECSDNIRMRKMENKIA